MKYKNKKVLVCGMGKSGNSAARLLLRHGARVMLADSAAAPQVDADLLQNSSVSTHFGKNPDEIVADFDILVLSPGISVNAPFVEAARRAEVAVIGEFQLAAGLCAATIIAITGTNGKTTTTSMAGGIMQDFANTSQIVGNIGLPFCDVADKMGQGGFAVAEVSSFQLETITDFRPKISAVLNIAEDHLDRHITMENYVAMKERIFENQRAQDFCVLNHDNEYTRQMAAKTAAQVIFFGRGIDKGVFANSCAICINWGDYVGEVLKIADLPIPGEHNLENAMAATAIAAAAGVPIDIIARGLRSFRAVAHRLEFVREVGGVAYYNDSKATNVDSALSAIKAIAAARPVVLIGGGQGKGQDFIPLVSFFGGKVKSFIIMGEDAGLLADACKSADFADYTLARDMEEAVKIAAQRASGGDAVLLSPACASYDMFANFEHRGEIFKEIVMKL